MPLNVSRYCASVFITFFGLFAIINAQTQQASPEPLPQSPSTQPIRPRTMAEVMGDRITRAKAFIAVRNYPAAILEIESIRRDSAEPSVNAVANVLLMNSYLELGDYHRAREFLGSLFTAYRSNNPSSDAYYQVVAGQVIKSARVQADRYRSLGLLVSDRNLPLEAVSDIEKMREMLELVAAQGKELAEDPGKSAAAVAIREEATTTRAALARDDYDARRWRDAAADLREQMASSRSIVIDAVDLAPAEIAVVPVSASNAATPESAAAKSAEPARQSERPVIVVGGQSTQAAETAAEKKDIEAGGEPLEVGSLLPFATRQAQPTYPPAARQMRATGVVRVEIIVDEQGDVAEIQRALGNAMLQSAARDAIRKWKFRPFSRDGQPVRAAGFVNFNFSL
jgi:periplasmic protein TonB